ncbi:LamG domain-containing protein [Psychromonas sp. PT13]|uniref:LamG domain-containing protein n=1 Tax=Psychromonas sp. PT13 TaxID=3439547 RepID=UPI003EBFE801
MKLTKISKFTFVPLSTLLIFGCDHPFTSSSSDDNLVVEEEVATTSLTADYEWDFSDIDADAIEGDKELLMSKSSDNVRTLVTGANALGYALDIQQSDTSGSYGYHYTTMDSTTDPLAATDGVISMEIVFKSDDITFNSTEGQDLQLLENTDSDTGWKVIVSKSSWKPQFKLYNGSGSTSVSGTTVLESDTWYDIVATYDNNEAKIYVNGVLEGTETITDYIPNTKDGDKVYIGGGSSSSQKNLDGSIDSAAFWLDTLTADEIATRAEEFGFTVTEE